MEAKQVHWHPLRIVINCLLLGAMIVPLFLILFKLINWTWSQGNWVPFVMLGGFILLLVNTQIDWKYGGKRENYLQRYEEIKKEFKLSGLKIRDGDISTNNIIVDDLEFEYLAHAYGDDPDEPRKEMLKFKNLFADHIALWMHNNNTGAMYGQFGIYISTGRKIEG